MFGVSRSREIPPFRFELTQCEVVMEENEKPRPVAPFELPETLKQFKKDHWKFGVVVIYAAVILGLGYIFKMH